MEGGDEKKEAEGVAKLTDQRVVDAFRELGKLLQKYHSGKLPRLFHTLPQLNNWQEIIDLTVTEKWSAHSMYQGVKAFSARNHYTA